MSGRSGKPDSAGHHRVRSAASAVGYLWRRAWWRYATARALSPWWNVRTLTLLLR